MRWRAAAVAMLLLVSGCASSGDRASARLPAATLPAFPSGSALDLRALKGPAVVNLWASWCGPCRREMPIYQEYAAAHAGSVSVVGVDFRETSSTRAERLVRDTGVSYPLYADPTGAMGAKALPELILVDAEGEVTHREYVEITSVTQLEELVETHLGVAS